MGAGQELGKTPGRGRREEPKWGRELGARERPFPINQAAS